MNELQVIEIKGQRVLTTKQITEAYETEERVVQQNFRNNAKRYIIGKHFICLTGKELKEFKNWGENFSLVGRRSSALYLWTEKGALLHAKSINTDKAWEVYDYLVDHYFRTKEINEGPAAVVEKKEVAPVQQPVAPQSAAKLPEINNPIKVLSILLRVAAGVGIEVNSYTFKSKALSMLVDNQIVVKKGITVEQTCYELAWELSHALIHRDAGNIIESPLKKEYNQQADRAADMIIKVLNAC